MTTVQSHAQMNHSTFIELVQSRREWIEGVLIPWCRTASRAELLKAELDWADIAGRIAPEKSLWQWAWERFPGIVLPELKGLDESTSVAISLKDGRSITGFPDARLSVRGHLYLVGRHLVSGSLETYGPFSIDDILSVQCLTPKMASPPERAITPGPTD